MVINPKKTNEDMNFSDLQINSQSSQEKCYVMEVGTEFTRELNGILVNWKLNHAQCTNTSVTGLCWMERICET